MKILTIILIILAKSKITVYNKNCKHLMNFQKILKDKGDKKHFFSYSIPQMLISQNVLKKCQLKRTFHHHKFQK